jgi:hypothetical protein
MVGFQQKRRPRAGVKPTEKAAGIDFIINNNLLLILKKISGIGGPKRQSHSFAPVPRTDCRHIPVGRPGRDYRVWCCGLEASAWGFLLQFPKRRDARRSLGPRSDGLQAPLPVYFSALPSTTHMLRIVQVKKHTRILTIPN